MSEFAFIGSSVLGNSLQQFLMCDEIVPGTEPAYQTCKSIYLYHVLGAKMAEAPISMAQSQRREISIPNSPESVVKDRFEEVWDELECDKVIFNTKRTSRIYGIASVAAITEGTPADRPLDFKSLSKGKIAFNVLDPLNTAGSLVLNQDPNAFDFQKHRGIVVNGTTYHGSRTVVVINEEPIYLGYTVSAFGYVGRSVYQRALYPLKSFIQSTITDDMITRKAGVLIAKIKQQGSIIDAAMAAINAFKRNIVKESSTNNVISIDPEEEIETLNLQNLDGAFGMARTDILKNIATAADMPAVLLENETMTEGFGEGTEDAKNIAGYIERFRREMEPLYKFFDRITMYRAWTPEFYITVQKQFPNEYGKVPYVKAFYDWSNSFHAEWPSLLREPESELSKVEDVKLKAIIAALEVLMPEMDPVNKATLIEWAANNMNTNKILFQNPLDLDYAELAAYTPPAAVAGAEGGSEAPQTFSARA